MGPPEVGPPGLYLVGDGLYGVPGRARVQLATHAWAPFSAGLSPVGVASADGRYVAYNSWRELRDTDPAISWEDQGIKAGDGLAVPSLHVYDLEAGHDSVLQDGGYSIAWRSDGTLAYVKGADPVYRAWVRYVGDVFVQPSLGAPAERWTTEPANYTVVAWAGERLLVYRITEGEHIDTLVLDGPGRVRVLARGQTVVAVSPDGSQVFVEQGPAIGRPIVRVLNIADGTEAASLDLSRVDPAVGYVRYGGDWSSDSVVATVAAGLGVFHVEPNAVSLEKVIRLDSAVFPAGAENPQFTDDEGGRIVGQAGGVSGQDGKPIMVFAVCDLAAAGCQPAIPAVAAKAIGRWPAWRSLVYNPSCLKGGP